MEEDGAPGPTPPDKNDFLAALTARVLAGERVDPEPLCAAHPEHAATIREICGNADRIAKQLAEGHGDTVRVAPESRGGSFDSFLDILRKRIGPDRYRVKGSIAVGGMGAILRVEDEVLNRPLAMKVILGQGDAAPTGQTPAVDDRTLGRFLDEAQVTAQLDHPGIVPIHELGVDATGRVYFTMKLVKGETLEEVFEKVKTGAEGWNLTRALGCLLRVAEAMAYAHDKGVLHRDLKPSNIMVGRFGEVFVMDWGLARILGEPDRRDLRIADAGSAATKVTSPRREHADETPDTPIVTMDGDIVGTPAYMPPEQADGRLEEVGPRSDVYSFGAMLYHLLAGQKPYVSPGARISARTVLAMVLRGPPDPIVELAPKVPPMLIAICEKAMARKAGDRYADMKELAGDLRAYLEGRVVRAYRTGAMAEVVQWVRRNRFTASTVVCAVVTVVSVTGAFVNQLHSRNTELQDANLRLDDARRTAVAEKNWAEYVTLVRAMQQSTDSSSVAASGLRCTPELRGWEWRQLYQSVVPAHYTIELGDGVLYATAIAWSRDGRRLYAATDGRIRMFDAGTGTESDIQVATNAYIQDIAVSPDDRQIAVTGESTSVYDAATLRLLWRRRTPQDEYERSIDYSPNGDLLATVGDTGIVVVLDSIDGGLKRVLPTRISDPSWAYVDPWKVLFSPSEPIVAITNHAGTEVINYERSWLATDRISTPVKTGSAVYMRFNESGSELYVCRQRDKQGPWSKLSSAHRSDKLSHFRSLRDLYGKHGSGADDWWFEVGQRADSEFASELESYFANSEYFCMDPKSGSHGEFDDKLEFSPELDRIAFACPNGHIHVGLVEALRSPSFATVNQEVLAASMDRTGRIRYLTTQGTFVVRSVDIRDYVGGKIRRLGLPPHYPRLQALALSGDGEFVALASKNRVEVISTSDGTRRFAQEFPDQYIRSVAFDTEGAFVAIGFSDRINLFDMVAGTRSSVSVPDNDGLSRGIRAIALSRDAKRVVALVGGMIPGLYLWSGNTDEPVFGASTVSIDDILGHDLGSYLSLSPDGERCAIATDVGARVLSLPSFDVVWQSDRHASGYLDVAWSEDGSALLSSAPIHDRTRILIWRAPKDLVQYDRTRNDWEAKCGPIASKHFETHDNPIQVLEAIESDASLSEEDRAGVRAQWRMLMSETAAIWWNEVYAISNDADRTALDVEKAIRLIDWLDAVYETDWLRSWNADRLIALGLYERARRAILGDDELHETEEISADEAEWNIDDRRAALLALAEAGLGDVQTARRWLALGKIQLTTRHDSWTRRLVQEARAACGLPLNPEGLPPIPDDDTEAANDGK